MPAATGLLIDAMAWRQRDLPDECPSPGFTADQAHRLKLRVDPAAVTSARPCSGGQLTVRGQTRTGRQRTGRDLAREACRPSICNEHGARAMYP